MPLLSLLQASGGRAQDGAAGPILGDGSGVLGSRVPLESVRPLRRARLRNVRRFVAVLRHIVGPKRPASRRGAPESSVAPRRQRRRRRPCSVLLLLRRPPPRPRAPRRGGRAGRETRPPPWRR